MATVPSAATAGPRLGRPPGPSAATLAQQAAKRAAQAASGGSGGSSAASVAGKRGRVDKKLPNKVEAFVPESSLFNQLVQTEKKVDAMLLRKWIEREEATRRPQRTRRTLRVFLSNIVANQPYQQSDNEYEALDQATINEGAPQPPSWTMRIEGRLLEPLATAGTTTAYQLNLATKRAPKFSQLVRKIVVELDRDPSLYPDSNNLIEWIPTVDHQPVDGFEIKRTGDQNVNARVIIDLQHQPQRYKVHQQLASVIGVHSDTRSVALVALYQYIRLRKLQKPEDRNVVIFDEPLRQAFGGVEAARFVDLPELLARCLGPTDPVVINFTVRIDTDVNTPNLAYDIDFDLQDNFGSTPNMFSETEQKDLARLDAEITARLQVIQQSKLKREFMLAFASSPVYFIQAWLDAQARDQKMMLGDTSISADEQRHANLFSQPWVHEAISHYLSDMSARRTEELMKQVQHGTAHLQ